MSSKDKSNVLHPGCTSNAHAAEHAGQRLDRKQLCRTNSCDPLNELNVHQLCTFAAMNAKHTGYIGKSVLRDFREVIVHLYPA